MTTVYLVEEFGNLEDGYALRVDEMELWTPSEVQERLLDTNQLVMVTDRFGTGYYIHIDIVEEMSNTVV